MARASRPVASSRSSTGARSSTSKRASTSQSPARITFTRLWPIAFTAIAAGVLGIFFPGVAAVGAGYALIVSLAWHTREAAVLGIEHRDGVKFYVVPGHPLKPIELVRAPGLRG